MLECSFFAVCVNLRILLWAIDKTCQFNSHLQLTSKYLDCTVSKALSLQPLFKILNSFLSKSHCNHFVRQLPVQSDSCYVFWEVTYQSFGVRYLESVVDQCLCARYVTSLQVGVSSLSSATWAQVIATILDGILGVVLGHARKRTPTSSRSDRMYTESTETSCTWTREKTVGLKGVFKISRQSLRIP